MYNREKCDLKSVETLPTLKQKYHSILENGKATLNSFIQPYKDVKEFGHIELFHRLFDLEYEKQELVVERDIKLAKDRSVHTMLTEFKNGELINFKSNEIERIEHDYNEWSNLSKLDPDEYEKFQTTLDDLYVSLLLILYCFEVVK